MRVLAGLVVAAGLLSATQAQSMDGVVASIKPIHSLVAGVMEGVGEPRLMVRGAASPHDYTLRPSDAAALQDAKLVFWVGPGMEAFLARPLQSLASGAKAVALSEAEGLSLLPLRDGGAFEAHAHDDGGDDHDNAKEGNEDHEHEDGDSHAGHGQHHDMHFWLDPENGKAIVTAIEAALAQADPANAAAYQANARKLSARIDQLTRELDGRLADAKGKPFIVFHDAYQYFENRFGLTAAGSITVSPETMPGADRLKTIRARIAETGAACVFAEPNFEPRLVDVVTEGTDAKSGVLDPEGASIEPGPDLYFTLLSKLSDAISSCLEG